MKFVRKGNAPELSRGEQSLVNTYIAMMENPRGPQIAIRIPERIVEYVRKYYEPVGLPTDKFRSISPRERISVQIPRKGKGNKDDYKEKSRRERKRRIKKPRFAPLLPRPDERYLHDRVEPRYPAIEDKIEIDYQKVKAGKGVKQPIYRKLPIERIEEEDKLARLKKEEKSENLKEEYTKRKIGKIIRGIER